MGSVFTPLKQRGLADLLITSGGSFSVPVMLAQDNTDKRSLERLPHDRNLPLTQEMC